METDFESYLKYIVVAVQKDIADWKFWFIFSPFTIKWHVFSEFTWDIPYTSPPNFVSNIKLI